MDCDYFITLRFPENLNLYVSLCVVYIKSSFILPFRSFMSVVYVFFCLYESVLTLFADTLEKKLVLPMTSVRNHLNKKLEKLSNLVKDGKAARSDHIPAGAIKVITYY